MWVLMWYESCKDSNHLLTRDALRLLVVESYKIVHILLITASLLGIFFIYWHKSNPFLNHEKGVISRGELVTLSAIVVIPWFWITKLYYSFISMIRGKHMGVNGRPRKARFRNARKHMLPTFSFSFIRLCTHFSICKQQGKNTSPADYFLFKFLHCGLFLF